jgi:hypothetical protein
MRPKYRVKHIIRRLNITKKPTNKTNLNNATIKFTPKTILSFSTFFLLNRRPFTHKNEQRASDEPCNDRTHFAITGVFK